MEKRSFGAVSISEGNSITILGTMNMAPPETHALQSTVCNYTVSSWSEGPSAPLNEATVRLGNSLLAAVIPESAILRDDVEGF
jgi:hypothetical protein